MRGKNIPVNGPILLQKAQLKLKLRPSIKTILHHRRDGREAGRTEK